MSKVVKLYYGVGVSLPPSRTSEISPAHPIAHVDLLALLSEGGQSFDKQIHVAPDDALLLQQRFLTESMRKRPPLSRVLFVARHRKRCGAGDILYGANMDGVFVELRVPLTVAVDVAPCLW